MKNSPAAGNQVEVCLTREEKINRLERLIDALDGAAQRGGDRDLKPVLAAAIRAQCVRCGVAVAGADLLRLAQVPSTDDKSWLKRLRSGSCVNASCTATNYRVQFLRHPELDWSALLAKGNEISEAATDTATETSHRPTSALLRKLPRNQLLIRAGILLLLLFIALVLRQIYFGGRIPIVREPEKFKVGTLPEGQTE